MSIFDIFKRNKTSEEKTASPKPEAMEETIDRTKETDTPGTTPSTDAPESMAKVAPKNVGKLDMVIAFDTTGSMAQYIGAVRAEVAELIPQLFQDNEDLRLGIVAFGDYCDMKNPQEFGDAYQVIHPTDNLDDLINFVRYSKNTHGGDQDEFYELVIKKIVEETEWRKGSTRSVLLIADANPHPTGYTYQRNVIDNQIDWQKEAAKAAENKIKIDTVSIHPLPWLKRLSAMTNGVSVPFKTGSKTADLMRASVMARGSMQARRKFDSMMESCSDEEIKAVYRSYKKERDSFD
ncbi:MAG: VWA domain-containing protein [Muribaculaceae bacterium]|nr:VWA domain-containing protein [Muribaculaceae bacterium]